MIKNKTNNKPRSIRVIVKTTKMLPVYGVVIPASIAERWLGTKVHVRESGNMIILESA